MELLLSANVHQGDEVFSIQSRGKQCSFMSLSAILTAEYIPLLEWSQSTFSANLYMKALSSDLTVLEPGGELLSIDDLPRVVNVLYSATMVCGEMRDTVISNYELAVAEILCSTSIDSNDKTLVTGEAETNDTIPVMVANNELPVTVANNELPVTVANNELPVTVANNELPVTVANNELPVTVANNELPVMVANNELPVTVANNELSSTTFNNKQTWFINFKKELQGLVITHHAIESHYYDFHTALSNTFLNNNYAILILEGYMMALVKQNNVFYLFDSHARDLNGMPYPNGTAVVIKFTSIVDMEQHLSSLSITLHVNLFELVPVQLSIICTFDQKRNMLKLVTTRKNVVLCTLVMRDKLDLRWLPTVTVQLNIDQSLRYQNDLAFRFLMLKNSLKIMKTSFVLVN